MKDYTQQIDRAFPVGKYFDRRIQSYITEEFHELALTLVEHAPAGRELSVALTELETSYLWIMKALEE